MSDPDYSKHDEPEVESKESGQTTLAELLDAPVSRSTATEAAPACLIGECVDARHPSLQGRVLVKFTISGHEQTRWLAKLQGLPVRVGDRVLMLCPGNSFDHGPEWIVTGVVDGFATRPE